MMMFETVTLRKAAGVLVLAVLMSGCGEAETSGASFKDDDPVTHDQTLIYSVESINVVVLESLPLQLQIVSHGHTRSGGWQDGALVLDEEASAGHRLVYRFIATQPTGMATQAISPIEASVRYGPWVNRMALEIRVIAQTNEEMIHFPGRD